MIKKLCVKSEILWFTRKYLKKKIFLQNEEVIYTESTHSYGRDTNPFKTKIVETITHITQEDSAGRHQHRNSLFTLIRKF